MSTATATAENWIPQATNHHDEARFNSLVAVHMEDLKRYGYWLTGDRSIADDLVQETLMRAWKSLHKLQKVEAVKGWLLTILRRENARRFERKQHQYSDIPTEDLSDGHRDYDTSTEAFVLRQALEGMDGDYREPLLMQVVGGYSQKEIALKLGISVGGAGTRLFRAKQKLRTQLEA